MRMLITALWIGLVTGLVEAAVHAFQRLYLNRMILLSRDVYWMAPLVYMLLLAFSAIGTSILSMLLPRLNLTRLSIFIFTFIGALSLLFMVKEFNRYTSMLLAAGLAFQISRIITNRFDRVFVWIRRTIPWLLALTVVLFIGPRGSRWILESRILAPSSENPNTPNVLLIVMDTVRAENMSLYDYKRPTTPQLERLAESSVVFEKAISTSPWTLPSHASMFTGHFPHEMTASWQTPLDGTYPTLAEVLRSHGYKTAGFVANTAYCQYESGLNRGFDRYEDYDLSIEELILSSSLGRTIANRRKIRDLVGYYDIIARKSAEDVNKDFLQWLNRQDYERPFFVFLNYFDAHEPYLPPDPFDAMFEPKFSQNNSLLSHQLRNAINWDRQFMTSQEQQAELDAYDGSIAYIDHQIGLLLDELEKEDWLENTLVIITSDHGEEFGEHGDFGHGQNLYLTSLHVPLLILFPQRLSTNMRVSDPVSLRDIPFTVLELLGFETGNPFPGNSLAPYLRIKNEYKDSAIVSDMLISELNLHGGPAKSKETQLNISEMISLVKGHNHYIRNEEGSEELYEFESDPHETQDITGSGRNNGIIKQFRGFLEIFGGEPNDNLSVSK